MAWASSSAVCCTTDDPNGIDTPTMRKSEAIDVIHHFLMAIVRDE